MSNSETVRRGFDSLANLEMDALLADWDPEVVFDVSDYEDWPFEQTVYHGGGEILTAYGDFMARAETLTIDVHEVLDVDDDHVLALYTETRRMAGAEPEQLCVGIHYTMRQGVIVHMTVHSDHHRARRAAGIA
jgi:ketosteroid isomerase-like protein